MDFMWQREPFQVGMSESIRRPGAPAPEVTEVLNSGAGGLMRLREGPASTICWPITWQYT